MPRRNLLVLVLVSVVSLICFGKVDHNRYGRVVVDAMNQIERRYVEPVAPNDLFEGAMEGMVRRLDDQHTMFVRRQSLQSFHEALDQEFGGVGIEVMLDEKTRQMTVADAMIGRPAPAYDAGIRAGDRILRINGESTQGLSLSDALARMRGAPRSPVRLSILHPGAEKPEEIVVVREKIQVNTVTGDSRNADGSWNFFLAGHDRIGYIRISSIAKETVSELRQAMDWLTAHKMRGLVLDLRDDPGGFLDQAVDICDMFIDAGKIVTVRRRRGDEVYEASGRGKYTGFPMAVLVNEESASASEIVAACLQDHGRAAIVGERTYGKGSVQDIIDLEGGQGALKLTIASYWRPNGKNIDKRRNATDAEDWGVRPDDGYQVPLDDEQRNQVRLWRRQRDVFRPGDGGKPPQGEEAKPPVDPQLAKAVEYVERPD